MFHNGAKSVLSVLNYLFLPTLLGLLGSLAHVIRGILDSFSRSSITLASRRRWETRVLLGGLLGLRGCLAKINHVKSTPPLTPSSPT